MSKGGNCLRGKCPRGALPEGKLSRNQQALHVKTVISWHILTFSLIGMFLKNHENSRKMKQGRK